MLHTSLTIKISFEKIKLCGMQKWVDNRDFKNHANKRSQGYFLSEMSPCTREFKSCGHFTIE